MSNKTLILFNTAVDRFILTFPSIFSLLSHIETVMLSVFVLLENVASTVCINSTTACYSLSLDKGIFKFSHNNVLFFPPVRDIK